MWLKHLKMCVATFGFAFTVVGISLVWLATEAELTITQLLLEFGRSWNDIKTDVYGGN